MLILCLASILCAHHPGRRLPKSIFLIGRLTHDQVFIKYLSVMP
ncbi:predicted protein [Plenodomus lingam JN3]|uniref:Predicted protein n=1 Tax=Leptosphaeria maculans (strain JN3 / isolate v23.1.3 / race Av1-4-5-6-7-8) TaxID=985895 RepID=E5AAB5_LEPMJ|nr:predicted protein [Plenodomus lingam JN3]CBY00606.1 predicted protein [Plenodomus lingam JN3]